MRSERIAVVISLATTALLSSWVALSWDSEPTLLLPVAFAGIGVIGEAMPQCRFRAGLLLGCNRVALALGARGRLHGWNVLATVGLGDGVRVIA
jgi:hypothetical protein